MIYAPPEPGMPFLVVGFAGDKPTGVFGCESRKAAKHLRREMQARVEIRLELLRA
ncbi:MAG: hypothetical protein ACHP84_10270 [Caulobacterales bacterium]